MCNFPTLVPSNTSPTSSSCQLRMPSSLTSQDHNPNTSIPNLKVQWISWQSLASNWICFISKPGYPWTSPLDNWLPKENTASRKNWNHLLVICTMLAKWFFRAAHFCDGSSIFWQPSEGMTIQFVLTATFTWPLLSPLSNFQGSSGAIGRLGCGVNLIVNGSQVLGLQLRYPCPWRTKSYS